MVDKTQKFFNSGDFVIWNHLYNKITKEMTLSALPSYHRQFEEVYTEPIEAYYLGIVKLSFIMW